MSDLEQEFDAFFKGELYATLTQNRRLFLIFHPLLCVVTALVIWLWQADANIFIWLCLVLGFHLLLAYYAKKPRPNQASHDNMLHQHSMASMITGFGWGCVVYLFFDADNPIYVFWLMTMYMGYLLSSLAFSYVYLRNFLSFTISLSIPAWARLLFEPELAYNLIALMTMMFIFLLAKVVGLTQRNFKNQQQTSFENKKLLHQLTEEKIRTDRALAAKNQFLAAASHDLRQPLNAINLFVDVLQPMQSNVEADDIIDKIRVSLRGLNSMLHGLLDISRLDANVIENAPQHLMLNSVMDELVEEVKPKASHIKIDNQISIACPVYADPLLLNRVIRNILDNAVKYTKQGHLRLYAEVQSNKVMLAIEDTGIGIPEDKLPLIFDEFFQLNNPERNRTKGLGLGLAIVKRLCSLANIEIKIDSEPDIGTTVTLAIQPGSYSHKSEPLTYNTSGSAAMSLHGKRILVVDDELDIVESTSRLLYQWQCEVVAADNQEVALAKLTNLNNLPDLIISDYRLADGRNGLDLIEAVRDEFNTQIPALLITGDTAPDKIQQAKAADCIVLYKPINSDDLETAIKNALTVCKLEKRNDG